MKRILTSCCALLIVILSGCASFAPRQEADEAITILHYNDFHAQNIPFEVKSDSLPAGKYSVGGAAYFLGHLKKEGHGTPGVLTLHAGDDFQGTPISSITRGESQIQILNTIRPDAMVLGNHEFDYGIGRLRDLLQETGFPVLGANLYDSTKGSTFAPPAVVKQVGRARVGIIGLLPPDLYTLTVKGIAARTSLLPVDSVVETHIRQLRQSGGVDLIVIVSHMGLGADTLLAMRHPDIDLIVGGHSHRALFRPIRKGRTLVVQAGSRGRYVGRLDLLVDLAGDSIRTYSGRLIETRTDMVAPDSGMAETVRRLESIADAELNEVIGTLAEDWIRSFTSESNIGNWQADAMRARASTDIALMNSGGLRKDLLAGPILRRDIWEINPFGNTLMTFEIDGRDVKTMLEWQAAKKGEFMQVSGLRYVFDSSLPDGNKVIEASVNGESIDPDRRYSIVTNNYVAGHVKDLLGLNDERITLVDTGIVDRDVIIERVINEREVVSRVEGRVIDRHLRRTSQ